MIKIYAAIRARMAAFSMAAICTYLVLAAACVSVWYAAERTAPSSEQRFILTCLGFAAVGYLVVGAGKACRAWFERRAGELFVVTLLLLSAISWEAKMHLSTASLNEAGLSNVQRAKHKTNVNTADELKRATERYNSAQFARDSLSREFLAPLPMINGKPVATGAEARAIADSSRAQKGRWDATNGCKETVNKSQREFCKTYADAIAALTASDAKAGIEARLNEANQTFNRADAELKAARAASDAAPSDISGERADTANLTKVAHMLGFSSYDAELSNALQTIIVLSVFLVVIEWMHQAEKYRHMPRKPWGIARAFRSLASAIRFAITGEKQDDVVEVATTHTREIHTVHDPLVAAKLARIQKWAASNGQVAAA